MHRDTSFVQYRPLRLYDPLRQLRGGFCDLMKGRCARGNDNKLNPIPSTRIARYACRAIFRIIAIQAVKTNTQKMRLVRIPGTMDHPAEKNNSLL